MVSKQGFFFSVIAGFCRDADEICVLLGYYTVLDFLVLEDGTDTLS
jgi:hypothetical protein